MAVVVVVTVVLRISLYLLSGSFNKVSDVQRTSDSHVSMLTMTMARILFPTLLDLLSTELTLNMVYVLVCSVFWSVCRSTISLMWTVKDQSDTDEHIQGAK